MKARIPCLALLLSASVLWSQEKVGESYSSTEGKCEIKFPGKATVKRDKALTIVVLEAMGGKAVYLLEFAVLSNEIATDNKELVKKFIDNGRDGIVKTIKGKILKEMDTTFGDYPARDIDAELPNGSIYRVRLILTPQFFYQIVTSGPKEFVDSKEAKAFQESFKLKK